MPSLTSIWGFANRDLYSNDDPFDVIVKVGPKGYIHGWIYVGPPGVGASVHHPKYGKGTVHRAENGKTHVRFDSGKKKAFEAAKETPTPEHFEKRPRAPRKPTKPAAAAPATQPNQARSIAEIRAEGDKISAELMVLEAKRPRWTNADRVQWTDARARADANSAEMFDAKAREAAAAAAAGRRTPGVAEASADARLREQTAGFEDDKQLAAAADELRSAAREMDATRDKDYERFDDATRRASEAQRAFSARLQVARTDAAARAADDMARQAKRSEAERKKIAKQLVLRLAAGEKFVTEPDNLGDLMHELSATADQPVNLSLMQLAGNGNENLFQRHMRDLPREKMPALPDNVEDLKPFIKYLNANGVKTSIGEVDPRTIVATQSQLVGSKVAQVAGWMKTGWKPGGAVIISKEGALLDGHHRWAGAAVGMALHEQGHPDYPNRVMPTALQVDLSIDELLAIGEKFSGPKKGMGEKPQ